MKLFLISQSENHGWDTYDSAVVAAKDEQAARNTHPSDYVDGWNGHIWYSCGYNGEIRESHSGSWVRNPEVVQVEYLAEYDGEAGVICASFNAG